MLRYCGEKATDQEGKGSRWCILVDVLGSAHTCGRLLRSVSFRACSAFGDPPFMGFPELGHFGVVYLPRFDAVHHVATHPTESTNPHNTEGAQGARDELVQAAR